MNRTAGRGPLVLWRRLTLWPRLAIGVTVGFLVLFAGFSVLGIRAVDASTNRILHERLAITEELAEDFDGLLQHRFSDLAAFDARPSAPAVERRLLTEIFHASGGEFTTLSLLDGRGGTLGSLGPGAAADVARAGAGFVPRALASRRAVSAPFRDAHGVAVVALAVPVARGRLLVATLDLAGPDVMERLDAARRLGRTGHAELVGPGGIALASTERGAALVPASTSPSTGEMLKPQAAGHRERRDLADRRRERGPAGSEAHRWRSSGSPPRRGASRSAAPSARPTRRRATCAVR